MPLHKKVTIGTRVELTDPSPFYIINERNPLKGGTYACVGTICGVSGVNAIMVNWDNGENNGYRKSELTEVNNTKEYHSIW